MMDEPPGLLPEPLIAAWRQQVPHLYHEQIDDTNHYTILLGERAAAIVAARITDPGSWPVRE